MQRAQYVGTHSFIPGLYTYDIYAYGGGQICTESILYRSKKSCTEFICKQKKLYGIYIEAKKVARNFSYILYIIFDEIQSLDRAEIFIPSFSAPELYPSVFLLSIFEKFQLLRALLMFMIQKKIIYIEVKKVVRNLYGGKKSCTEFIQRQKKLYGVDSVQICTHSLHS